LLHQVLVDYQLFVNWCLGTIDRNLEEGKGQQWLHMQHFHGPEQIKAGYLASLKGNVAPDAAVIMSLWDSQSKPQPLPSTSKL
jgi:hypothetical protein